MATTTTISALRMILNQNSVSYWRHFRSVKPLSLSTAYLINFLSYIFYLNNLNKLIEIIHFDYAVTMPT